MDSFRTDHVSLIIDILENAYNQPMAPDTWLDVFDSDFEFFDMNPHECALLISLKSIRGPDEMQGNVARKLIELREVRLQDILLYLFVNCKDNIYALNVLIEHKLCSLNTWNLIEPNYGTPLLRAISECGFEGNNHETKQKFYVQANFLISHAKCDVNFTQTGTLAPLAVALSNISEGNDFFDNIAVVLMRHPSINVF